MPDKKGSFSPKNYILIIIGAIMGSIIVFFYMFMGSFGSIPSNSQSEFVKNCGELNGKKLTADNIQKLNGWTYLKGTPAKGAIINESIEKLKNKRDPWFAIYNVNDTDGTWVCNIFLNKDQTTIKAVPDYYYE